LTDTNENLKALLPALARAGVRAAVVSFLFLRWGISFSNDLAWGDWSARKMRRLYTHKVTDYCGGGTIWLPPTAYRNERFKELETIACESNVAIKLCHCKNSDLPKAQCCHPTDSLFAANAGDPQLKFI
jgi:hypothetical protein